MLKMLIIMAASLTLGANASELKELNNKINALADQIEELKKSKSSSDVSIGGYGEIVYSKTEEGESGTEGGEPKFDNKRFILYVGYDFSPKWSLVSEIEVEHADEIYMEQAYLNFAHSDQLHYRVGTLLIPMGHLNLYHEPTTFLGAQRTQVETRIQPSTWRENGIGLYGEHANLTYHLYYVNGLVVTNELNKSIGQKGVRNGRQKASNANAHKGAIVGRLDYKVSSNSEIGASVYSGKLNGTSSDVSHNVYDLRYKGKHGAFHTRALYTALTLSNTEDLKDELSIDVAEKMSGYYVELGYDVLFGRSQKQLIPFIRHEVINTQESVADGVSEDEAYDEVHQTLGIVYRPLENISLKADFTTSTNEAKSGTNSWNLGVGWNF